MARKKQAALDVQTDEFFIDTGLTEEDARQRLGAAKTGDEA